MHKRRGIAAAMLGVMLTVSVLPADVDLAAAATPKLSRKSITVKKGKSVTVSLKKSTAAKKIKWKIANKKVASIKAKKKGKVTVRGKKVGRTRLNCQFVFRGKKKKLSCKVIVKSVKDSKDPVTNVDKAPQVTAPSMEPGTSNHPKQTETPMTANPPVTNPPEASSPAETTEPTVPPASASPPVTILPSDPPATPSPTAIVTPTANPMETPSNPSPTATVTPTLQPTVTPANPSPTPEVTPTPDPMVTPIPAEQGVILDNDYSDGSTGGFSGRGDANVQSLMDPSIASIPVLAVTGRTANWHGTQTDAAGTLMAGKSYTVSTAVYQKAVDNTQLKLTLSYKDGTGKVNYQQISAATVSRGEWAALQGDIVIPEDATEILLYFEEVDGTHDFYVAPVQMYDKDRYDDTAIDQFESDSLSDFQGRGSAQLAVVPGGVTGNCMSITGRTASWNGVASTVQLNQGASVYISGYVKTDAENYSFKTSAEATDSSTGTTTYPGLLQMDLKKGEWTKFSCSFAFDQNTYSSIHSVYFELTGANDTVFPDFYLDNVTVCVVDGVMDLSNIIANGTYAITGSLKEAYTRHFTNVGTCMNYGQLTGADTMEFAAGQYNSISAENEMKPDYLLNKGTMSTAEAKGNKYYFVPEGYGETTCPKINYDAVDKYLQTAAANKMRIRFHVFVWHQQTPKWFFKENYNENGRWVTPEVMNARLEFFIKSVIRYISLKEEELGIGDVVYCYDVVNEYFHNNNNPDKAYRDEVYYPEKVFDPENPGKYEQTTEPVYVKNAFAYARDILDSYGKQHITLFYNDFNTYLEADKIIKMMEYINAEKILCTGVGMQSHLDVGFPSVEFYTSAMEKFLKSDYIKEVQITELDVTAYPKNESTLEDQMTYYSDLMKAVLALKKTYSDKMTGLTFWGLYDSVSWRAEGLPLLFASTTKAKGVYYKVLEAAAE
ncbi:MAG: hypothetical protein HFG34_07195 [Eubacterium sp.]|nr:hypothetical protein [Eubacterium sp.]